MARVLNQSIIKNENLRNIYDCVSRADGISRAEIARMLGLSKPTVSALVDELISDGLIMDAGARQEMAGPGRNPNNLLLRTGRLFMAVLLWSAGKVIGNAVDLGDGSLVVSKEKKTEDVFSYADASQECFLQLTKSLEPDWACAGAALIFPGLVDAGEESLISTPLEIDSGQGKKIVSQLRKAFKGITFCILNDTACLVYAEIRKRRNSDDDFVFINFQKGIGSAIYIDHHIIGGSTGSFTQIGHVNVKPDGLPCACGRMGCLEAMIGDEGVRKRWGNLVLPGGKVSYLQLADLTARGNTEAAAALEKISDEFSYAMINVVTTVKAKEIIIGGHGRYLGEHFLESVRKKLSSMGFPYMTRDIQASYSVLDEDEIFYGAVCCIMKLYFDYAESEGASFILG